MPHQTANHRHTTVTPHGKRDRRMRICMAQLADYEIFGTFHSHPAWGNLRSQAKPSDWDARMMTPGELDLIIAVNDAKRPRRFSYSDNGRVLRGSVSDFALTLACFYKPPLGDLAVRRTLIRCPYALGFEPDFSLK